MCAGGSDRRRSWYVDTMRSECPRGRGPSTPNASSSTTTRSPSPWRTPNGCWPGGCRPRRGTITAVQVRARRGSSSRFVAFYEPAYKRGRYAALGDSYQSVALTNLHAPPAPWDDAMLDLMVAAEQEDAERAQVAGNQASG